MNLKKLLTKKWYALLFLVWHMLITSDAKAQQLQMSDFVLFSGNASGSGYTPPVSPGAGVIIGSNSTVNTGTVGSLKFVQTNGPATISGNIASGGLIDLAANCIVTGKISAANSSSTSGTILAVGSGATLGGNIDVKGNIVVASGSVFATVTHPSGTTYTGPAPAGGNVVGTPSLPTFPALPPISSFSPSVVMADINSTRSISPGAFGDMKLPGGKTLTLSGPGEYIFNKILNQSDNDLIFDFKNSSTGVFKIYVHNDVDLGQIHASFINGGSASRIYTEVHGNGSSSSNGTYSFLISNCTAAIKSSWLGTVWAPYAAIKIGSLSGGTDITGALWSGTQVNVRCGVTINSVSFTTSVCVTPNVNAGADKLLTCSTTSVQLSGSSSTSGVTYKWVASNGGNIVSGATTATPIVNASGTYTLTVTTATGGCTANDVALVTINNSLPNVNAGSDKQITCTATSVQLSGSSATSGVSYNWIASNGGIIVTGANTATPTVNAAGTYTLTVRNTTTGCSNSDVAIVTLNNSSPNANAGLDKALTCAVTTVQLNGSSTTSGVTYAWTASNGGAILSGSNTATPTVNAAGTYTLTVRNPLNGCTKSDVALVTFNNSAPSANAGADKALTCSINSLQLSGSSTSSGVTYNWIASNGGNILSGATTLTPTINAAGTYTLRVTQTSSGCVSTDAAIVTMNSTLPNVNAGADVDLSCTNQSAHLSGTSSTANAQFSWTTSATGKIISGATYSNPLVNGVGKYTLTVTDPSNGCIASDFTMVNNGCILLYYPEDTVGKVSNKIGSELTSLFKNYNPNAADTTQNIFRLNHDSVWIEVISRAGKRDSVAKILTSLPIGIMTDTINNGNSLIITGKFPIAHLGLLNTIPDRMISYCRPLYSPSVSAIGAVSKGDSAMRSDIARNGFNLNGNGIKVGIISDSYNTLNKAASDVSNGELPGVSNPNSDLTAVTVLKECTFKSVDEGRAMAQIVYDVAPKAALSFRTGFNDANDFAKGIAELQQSGCNVIVDDVTYITEPFFTDGVVARAVDNAAAQGVAYFTAAGNFGGKSYQGTFAPAPPPAGKSGVAHNFGGGDILQRLSFNQQGDYTIVLQWEDGIYSDGILSGTQNDLDIYLTDDAGKILVGYNRNNLGGDPLEVLPISVPTASAFANIMIIRAAGSSNVKFKYIVFRGDVTILEGVSDSSTIVGQANANGAIAVAAMRYNKSNTIEDYSSIGGTTVNGSVRNKPDITAPDGTNTTVNFGSTDIEGDKLPNFFGTSAAAPHAAASAALIMEAKSKYYNQSINAADMKALLKSTAKDLGAAGFDFVSGAGLVQTDAAIRTFASPEPIISTLKVPAGVTPGTQAFTVEITGQYMNAQSKVYLKGVQVPSAFVNSTQVNATIPVFAGNPPVTVYNPPTVPNLNDGGFSDPLYFTPLKKVVVTAENKTKKYGEKIPTFTVKVTIDGTDISNTNVTMVDLKLYNNIKFSTSANSFSNSQTTPYYIHPEFITKPSFANATDSILLSTYSFNFVDGGLNINRLPLSISSRDTNMVYGSTIDGKGLKYNYVFDKTNVDAADQPVLINSITNDHALEISSAVALADERITSGVTGRVITNSDLINLSLAASEGAIQNGRVITNGVGSSVLIDIAPQSIFDFEANPDSVFLISGYSGENPRSLMNGRVITNGVTGRVITNGVTGRVITNGVTGRVITNSTSNENSNQKLALLVDSIDIFDTVLHEITGIKSVNLITGTTVGTWRMVPAAFLSDNFDITYGIGSLTITKAPLTIKADNKSCFYGSANPIFTATYTGFVNGDDESDITPPVLSTLATNLSPAGSYTIKINGGLAANYSMTKIPGTLTIKKAILNVTADNKSKTYGDANPNFTLSYSGFVNGENETVLSSLPTASSLATNLSSVGNYAISVSGGLATNYTVNKVNGVLTITKAVLTATANNATKVYGTANPNFTISYSGFLNGDILASITQQPNTSTTATTLSPVGNYPISLSGGSSTNYSFNLVSGSLSITPATLTVKADDKHIFQGDVLPAFTSTISGFVTGGANTIASGPSYTVSPVYSGIAGNYAIIPSNLVLVSPNNYAITYKNGILNVNTKGSGCSKLKTSLICVDTLIGNSSGFKYVAKFACSNSNSTSVYVAAGPDNYITTLGSYSGILPEWFAPGTTYFNVNFDGVKLQWTVNSYQGTSKSASASEASSTSARCASHSRLAQTTISTEETTANLSTKLYPNPTEDKLFVLTTAELTSSDAIQVLDILGKVQQVKILSSNNNSKFELDVRNLPKGIYFVKIISNSNEPIMRFMKE